MSEIGVAVQTRFPADEFNKLEDWRRAAENPIATRRGSHADQARHEGFGWEAAFCRGSRHIKKTRAACTGGPMGLVGSTQIF
jgi:hypothetical protein